MSDVIDDHRYHAPKSPNTLCKFCGKPKDMHVYWPPEPNRSKGVNADAPRTVPPGDPESIPEVARTERAEAWTEIYFCVFLHRLTTAREIREMRTLFRIAAENQPGFSRHVIEHFRKEASDLGKLATVLYGIGSHDTASNSQQLAMSLGDFARTLEKDLTAGEAPE